MEKGEDSEKLDDGQNNDPDHNNRDSEDEDNRSGNKDCTDDEGSGDTECEDDGDDESECEDDGDDESECEDDGDDECEDDGDNESEFEDDRDDESECEDDGDDKSECEDYGDGECEASWDTEFEDRGGDESQNEDCQNDDDETKDCEYDESDDVIWNIDFVLHNIVIVENVDRNITPAELIRIFNIDTDSDDFIDASFLPESRGNGFICIIIFNDNHSARDFALSANRKLVFQNNVFACVMWDCILNIKELESSYVVGSGKLPDEVTVVSKNNDLDVTIDELVKKYLFLGEVTGMEFFVEDGRSKDLVHVKFRYLSEALSAEFAIRAKYSELDPRYTTVYVNVNTVEACRNLLRGSFPTEDLERAEILLPEYISMGCINDGNFDVESSTKCNIPNCPVCQNLTPKG